MELLLGLLLFYLVFLSFNDKPKHDDETITNEEDSFSSDSDFMDWLWMRLSDEKFKNNGNLTSLYYNYGCRCINGIALAMHLLRQYLYWSLPKFKDNQENRLKKAPFIRSFFYGWILTKLS